MSSDNAASDSLIEVQCISQRLDWQQALALPLQSLERDWYAASVPAKPSYAVALDTLEDPSGLVARLIFAVEVQGLPRCDFRLSCGHFVPELWRMDCAELFLGEEGSPAYQEFNLSPSGAWWSQGFARYREADPAFHRPRGVECYAQVQQQSEPTYWRACLAVPLTEIALPAFKVENAEKLRANVCFILGADPQQFVTAADLGPGEPDFHRCQRFAPLQMRSRQVAE